MTDVIYDSISIAVDMILSSAILCAIVVLLRNSTILSNYSANAQATAQRLNYYKEFNMYDNTTKLSSADAVSAMMYYRYDIDVIIKTNDKLYSNDKNNGKLYVEDIGTGVKTNIEYSELKNSLLASDTYSSILYENNSNVASTEGYKGGVVSGIYLTVETVGGGA